MAKKVGPGRPRLYPVLRPDFWGRPLRQGDFVNYAIPGNHKGAGRLVFGEIIGKRQGFLEVMCLSDSNYEEIHCKHGFQVVRIPGDVLKFVRTRKEVQANTEEVTTNDGSEQEGLQEGEVDSD